MESSPPPTSSPLPARRARLFFVLVGILIVGVVLIVLLPFFRSYTATQTVSPPVPVSPLPDQVSTVINHFGQMGRDPMFDPRADIDGNGVIDIDDLNAATARSAAHSP